MASLYLRARSHFIWIRYKDEAGEWRGRSTGYRKGNRVELRKAKALAARLTMQERQQDQGGEERFENWVAQWMEDRYGGRQATTLAVYRRYWRRLWPWLAAQGILAPRQLAYRHLPAYRTARLAAGAGNNTIVHEVKFLAVLMGEAVRREFCDGNPCLRAGLAKSAPAEKRPWTDAEIATAGTAIKSASIWMRATFVLGLYQAARLRQCAVPLADIDLDRQRIIYRKTKGDKPFTQPIDARAIPELRALIAARLADGKKTLCEIPEVPSVAWRQWLDALGLHGISHHGLRVTWITRAAMSGRAGRRGVTLAEAKRFVNHGSTAIHSLYQKLNADDVAGVPALLDLPQV